MIDTVKIKKYVLLYLPYALLLWFFSKCAEAYRLSPGSNALYKLMDAINGINAAFARPMPSLDSFDLGVGLIGAAAVIGFVYYKKKNAKKWRKDINMVRLVLALKKTSSHLLTLNRTIISF